MQNFTSSINMRLHFCKYPNDDELQQLREELGNFILVNLTTESEGLPRIKYDNQIVKPIVDRKVLPDDETIKFIKELAKLYCSKETIVINCRGGAGRSGTIAGLLYGFVKNLKADEVFSILMKAFNKRIVKSDKLIKLGVPQTKLQKDQMMRLLAPFDFYTCASGPWTNFYPSKVFSTRFQIIFKNSEALYQAYKNPDDLEYVHLLSQMNATESKAVGRKVKMVNNFEENKIDYMFDVLIDKVDSNPWIIERMLDFGIKPIFEHTKNDSFWGDNLDRTGGNHLGKCWKKVLLTLILNDELN